MAIVKKAIYAEDLLAAIRDDPSIKGKDFAKIKRHIADAQELDMIPVVHGRWIEHPHISYDGGYNGANYECSLCGFNDLYDIEDYNYCPQCGAKMDGKGDGE